MDFTIIIDSNQRTNLAENTNNCHIKISCPTQVNSLLDCEVLLFSISYPPSEKPNASYIRLISDNIGIYQQYAQKKTLSVYDNVSFRYSRNLFTCENFANKEIHFQLVDELGNPFLDVNGNQYNFPWTMVIKCSRREI